MTRLHTNKPLQIKHNQQLGCLAFVYEGELDLFVGGSK